MVSILDFFVDFFGDILDWLDSLSFGRGNGTMFTFLLAAFVVGVLINIIFSSGGGN